MINSKFDKKVLLSILSLFSISFLLSIVLMQLIAMLIFIMWLFERNDEKRKTSGDILYAILIFGLIRTISIFLSDFPSLSFQSFYKEAIFYTTAVSLNFYYKVLEKEELIKLFNFFIIGSVIISLIGIYRFYSGDVERAQSFSGSYTVFSSYLLTALSFSLFFIKDYSKKTSQVVWSLVYIILFLGIFTSLGRANLLIATIIFITAMLLKQIKPLQFALILFAFFLFFLINITSPSVKIQQRATNITMLSERDVILEGAAKIIFERPIIGYGPRTFSEVFPLKDKFQDKGVGGWHNDFLQIYFESGIIGLISFLILIFVVIKTALSQIKNKNLQPEFRNLSVAVLITIISLIFTAFFSGFITSVYISVVFVFFVSLLDRISIEKKLVKEKPNSYSTIK